MLKQVQHDSQQKEWRSLKASPLFVIKFYVCCSCQITDLKRRCRNVSSSKALHFCKPFQTSHRLKLYSLIASWQCLQMPFSFNSAYFQHLAHFSPCAFTTQTVVSFSVYSFNTSDGFSSVTCA